jgi:hypothetical protein
MPTTAASVGTSPTATAARATTISGGRRRGDQPNDGGRIDRRRHQRHTKPDDAADGEQQRRVEQAIVATLQCSIPSRVQNGGDEGRRNGFPGDDHEVKSLRRTVPLEDGIVLSSRHSLVAPFPA